MPAPHARFRSPVCIAALVLALAAPAQALDKQGSAHGGDIAGASEGFDLSGSLMLGSALYNPSYAARPDNSGLALMRYAAHVDADLIGRRLSIPLDLNLFSDRTADGAGVLAPSEFDVITGVTSTWAVGKSALEAGARVEHDRPVGRGGYTQTYVDARGRLLYSLANVFPRLGPALADGDVSGWLTLGVFGYNPTYAARPDNTGRALFRYAYHVELSLLGDLVSVGLDTTFFSDRRAHDPFRPSELDVTPELILHVRELELHVAYERDLPLDRGGLVQEFVYALFAWSFSGVKPSPRPLEHRGQILSP
jgi:hypothetical protein